MSTEAYDWGREIAGRIFLHSISAPEASGVARQVTAILHEAQHRLEAYEAALADVRKLVVAITDGVDREAVLMSLSEFFPSGLPCCSILIANGLSDPRALVQIDIDAWRDSRDDRRYTFPYSSGAVTVSRTDNEVFLSVIDGLAEDATNRSLKQAAAQAERAMRRLVEALEAVGARVDDVCKMTVHVPDRYYREAVYPEIGRCLVDVFPVSTGLILQGLEHPEALFSIDVMAIVADGCSHQRERKYHTSTTLYGGMPQTLDCSFSMAIRAKDRIFLRGQTGMDLEGRMHGDGDVVVQTEQAMKNVIMLLDDVGAELRDVVKVMVFVTDSAYLKPVHDITSGFFKDSRPTFSSVVVKGLAAPNLLMEIDILAVRPE